MKLDLVKLKELFDWNFGPPFLDEGIVTTWLDPDGEELRITIGPRDLSFDSDGNVVDAGTSFLHRLEMVPILDEDRPHLADLPPEILEKGEIYDAETFKIEDDDDESK